MLEQWGFQLRASFAQQLVWFPFSELTVMTHINPTDKYQLVREDSEVYSKADFLKQSSSSQSKQTVLSYFVEKLSEVCSRGLRRLSVLASQSLPLLASVLARVQFFSLWSVAKYR